VVTAVSQNVPTVRPIRPASLRVSRVRPEQARRGMRFAIHRRLRLCRPMASAKSQRAVSSQQRSYVLRSGATGWQSMRRHVRVYVTRRVALLQRNRQRCCYAAGTRNRQFQRDAVPTKAARYVRRYVLSTASVAEVELRWRYMRVQREQEIESEDARSPLYV